MDGMSGLYSLQLDNVTHKRTARIVNTDAPGLKLFINHCSTGELQANL